ncbi:MAG: hypothetical protein DIZ80_06585 [endosymbiont of Galathealinum brachiosum]|uniref:Rap1a immunity protein domain-containing protein n=1 Tax=endosymbiont of Galathealinum brachiosum TaxID=2200906 RepID=A0A370DGX6_9GAMM|nr:MAG: hypothetical protein DIZ80_06585 [endosymbiont of Galathealinum brachiosum]
MAINTSIINNQKKIKYKPYCTKGRMPASKFNYYCVPDNISNDNIIKIIAKQLPSEIDTIKTLRDNILTTLRSEYPCRKDNEALSTTEMR